MDEINKNWKTADKDITPEMIKDLDETEKEALRNILNETITTNGMPMDCYQYIKSVT